MHIDTQQSKYGDGEGTLTNKADWACKARESIDQSTLHLPQIASDSFDTFEDFFAVVGPALASLRGACVWTRCGP